MTAAVSEVIGGMGDGCVLAVDPPARRDDAAFSAFYAQHYGPVTGYALSLTADANVAADVAQEAFTRLYSRWRRIENPRGWLFFVATNLTRDHWRESQRVRGLTSALQTNMTPASQPYDPWLRDLVDRLPDRLREPVLLHYFADLPIQEVARLMRRPTGSIKQRLHQARQELGTALKDTP